MIKGVLFDLYGTLIITDGNTERAWLAELYRCLGKFGLNQSQEDFAVACRGFFSSEEPEKQKDGLTVYERRLKRACAALGINIDDEGIRYTAKSSVEAANNNCRLDPECHPVLSALRKRFVLGLISNYDHAPFVRTMLHRLDLARYFSTVVISEEAGIKKPAPAIFELALQEINLRPEEVVYVGDSIIDDIAGAINAKITPVLIQREASKNISPIFRDDFGVESEISSRLDNVQTIRGLHELTGII
jgi:HAD superfamily hydrolase (TIGR01549 family)